MKSVLSLLLAPLVIAAPGAKVSSRQVAESIHEAFAGAGKEFFGTATDKALLERDANAAIIKADFGQVTPENSMKWGLLEAKRGTYTWDGADFLADWATENGKVIRGHTLIWHSQLPSWVHALTDADELRKVIRDHVTAVVGRYAGKVAHWVSYFSLYLCL